MPTTLFITPSLTQEHIQKAIFYCGTTYKSTKCPWRPSEDGTCINLIGAKDDNSVRWLHRLITIFFKKNGYNVSGSYLLDRTSSSDYDPIWFVIVHDNIMEIKEGGEIESEMFGYDDGSSDDGW